MDMEPDRMRYKRRYEPTSAYPWQIIKKEMIYIGKLTWVFHSKYKTAKERNDAFEKLNE